MTTDLSTNNQTSDFLQDHHSTPSVESVSNIPLSEESPGELEKDTPKKKNHNHKYSKRLPTETIKTLNDWYVKIIICVF